MKKLLLLLFALTVFSCSNDDDGGDEQTKFHVRYEVLGSGGPLEIQYTNEDGIFITDNVNLPFEYEYTHDVEVLGPGVAIQVKLGEANIEDLNMFIDGKDQGEYESGQDEEGETYLSVVGFFPVDGVY